MDNEKNDENFSRDADQTRYIYLIGLIALTSLVADYSHLNTLAIIKYTMLMLNRAMGMYPFIFTA